MREKEERERRERERERGETHKKRSYMERGTCKGEEENKSGNAWKQIQLTCDQI